MIDVHSLKSRKMTGNPSLWRGQGHQANKQKSQPVIGSKYVSNVGIHINGRRTTAIGMVGLGEVREPMGVFRESILKCYILELLYVTRLRSRLKKALTRFMEISLPAMVFFFSSSFIKTRKNAMI